MCFVDLAGIRRATGLRASRPAAQRNLRFRNKPREDEIHRVPTIVCRSLRPILGFITSKE